MAAVHLCGLGRPGPETEEFFAFFRGWAARSSRHRLVERPGEAGLILCVYGTGLRAPLRPEEEALLRERADDCFAFDAQDRPVGFLPGLYAALPAAAFDRGRFRAYCYPAENRHVEEAFQAGMTKSLFFSFLGGASCALRQRIYGLGHGRSDVVIEDTTAHQEWNPHQPEWEARKRRYAGVLAASEFALCPRGAGTGSIRLFEAMQAGAVPVAISDRYVLPDGPDWDAFLVRLPERAVAEGNLPERLAPYRGRSREMGRAARRAWEQWFAPAVWLDRIVEGTEAIRASRRRPEAAARRLWPWWKLKRQVREEAFNALRMARNRIRPR